MVTKTTLPLRQQRPTIVRHGFEDAHRSARSSPIVVEFPAGKEVGALSPTTTAVTPTTPKARSGPVSPLKLAQVFEPPASAPPSMPLVNANADSAAANLSGAGPSRRKRTLSRGKSRSFATNRRQATKLTNFFGVEYLDLYQAMVTTTTPTTNTSTDAATSTSSLLTEETKEPSEKKPSSYHYQKVRKSGEAALPSRGSPAPPPPPSSASPIWLKKSSTLSPPRGIPEKCLHNLPLCLQAPLCFNALPSPLRLSEHTTFFVS